MGGMGKTTLAQLAYDHEDVTAHFDQKIWVCVSDLNNEIEIAQAIIEILDGNLMNSNSLQILLNRIEKHDKIVNKKLLLVLDDVWTDEIKKWENFKLRVILRSCAEGCILVTTQKESVAKMMGATDSMIRLDILNDKDCLTLFNSIAFLGREGDEFNDFGAIGAKIVKRCKGLPLIVKTLSSLVHDKIRRLEWENVLTSKVWELEGVKEQVFLPLLLSYYDLASAVKQCLLYCAIFPKDYIFEKDNLIELWMSQDYLNLMQNEENRKIGQSYFDNLVMRSFFQDFKKDDMGNIYRCKMHDIVHGFVQFLSRKECIITEVSQGANHRMELLGDMVRHLTLVEVPEGPFSFPTSFHNCKNLRTLTSLYSRMTTISPCSILEMKCLRTLNLSHNIINELPKEIGKLIHLRYLNLSYSEDLKKLPDNVCDLVNLQTVVLIGCWKLEKLPKAMGKLMKLKHLYVKDCDQLKYLAKGIGSLDCLQALDCFYVCDHGDDVDDGEALKLGNLGSMDQLQGSLQIESMGNAKDVNEVEKAQLGNKKYLSDLVLQFQKGDENYEQRKSDEEILEALQPHPNLESLSVWNCHCTTWSLYRTESLHNLRRVVLGNWKFCALLPPLGKLSLLEILEIFSMHSVKKVGVEFLGIEEEIETFSGILFPKLKHLCIGSMRNWKEWEGIIEDSSKMTIMPHLSTLRISQCQKLKELPDFVLEIPALHTLEIEKCAILEGDYEKDVGKKWPKISHIQNITIIKSPDIHAPPYYYPYGNSSSYYSPYPYDAHTSSGEKPDACTVM